MKKECHIKDGDTIRLQVEYGKVDWVKPKDYDKTFTVSGVANLNHSFALSLKEKPGKFINSIDVVKVRVFNDKDKANEDWHEKNPCNEDEPSCEECGDEDYDYHHTEDEYDEKNEVSNTVDYLKCNGCGHIFDAGLR